MIFESLQDGRVSVEVGAAVSVYDLRQERWIEGWVRSVFQGERYSSGSWLAIIAEGGEGEAHFDTSIRLVGRDDHRTGKSDDFVVICKGKLK